MSKHQEDWTMYMIEANGEPATIGVDLGWIGASPVAALPMLIRVLLSCHDRRENGFPSAKDFETLYQLEDQTTAYGKTRRWTHVGTVTNTHGRELVFYGPAGKPSAKELGFIPTDRRAKDHFRVVEDAGWEFYREFLYPGPDQLQVIKDAKVLTALAELGDVHEAPRRVDHWAYFPTAAKRDKSHATLVKLGYTVERDRDPDETNEQFGVQFFHETDVTADTISSITVALAKTITKLGGEYDGWETIVIKKKPTSLWRRLRGS